jgi:hypothetical protein
MRQCDNASFAEPQFQPRAMSFAQPSQVDSERRDRWAARWKGLTPLLAILISLIIIDVSFWAMVPDKAPLSLPRYEQMAATAKPDRPWLVLIGSSRGRDAVSEELLAEELERAGLPHQGFNLSIGGSGTPSLLYAALADLTPVLKAMPAGSRVIYLFSYFEMNFLQPGLLGDLPTGRELIVKAGMDPPVTWTSRLATLSGIAAFAEAEGWKAWPAPMGRLLQASSERLLLKRKLAACNDAGQHDYQVLEINDWSMRALARSLGGSLLIAPMPVGPMQQQDDADHGVDVGGSAYLDKFSRDTGVPIVADFPQRVGLPADAFVGNCDHLTRPEDKRMLARAVLELLK